MFGFLFTGIGILGVVLPGLPATIFFLIAASCFVRSSEKLYNKLLEHKIAGKYIRNYRKHKAMTKNQKKMALFSMWISISISVGIFLENSYIRALVIACGLIGTLVIIKVKTISQDECEL